MGLILAILLIVLAFAAIGFVLHFLWIIAAILLVTWVIGFFAKGRSGGRWYRW
jgi:hypothetical protein